MTKVSLVPQLRVALGPCRSCTTTVANMMGQGDGDVTVFLRPVNGGIWQDGKPDHRFFTGKHPEQLARRSRTFVAVESLCEPPRFDVFPGDEAITNTKPLFLFRNPLETWLSWKKNNIARIPGMPKDQGFSSFEDFKTAYRYTADLFKRAKQLTRDAMCLTKDHLAKNPAEIVRQLCQRWGIKFHPAMVTSPWRHKLDSNPNVVVSQAEQKWFNTNEVYLDAVRNRPGFQLCVALPPAGGQSSIQVSPQEKAYIEKNLMPLYEELQHQSEQDFPLTENRPQDLDVA